LSSMKYKEMIVLCYSNVQYKTRVHCRKALCLTTLSRLNPSHQVFDDPESSKTW
jgi:hypothetical protein